MGWLFIVLLVVGIIELLDIGIMIAISHVGTIIPSSENKNSLVILGEKS